MRKLQGGTTSKDGVMALKVRCTIILRDNIENLAGNRAIIFALVYFALIALFVMRLNFGLTGYPQGTNSLDFYMQLFDIKQNGIFPWYTVSDWGQPFPGFTGPTVYTILAGYLSFTIVIRALEALFFFFSGFLTYYSLSKSGFQFVPSIFGSTYYMLMAETSQFFEGHIGLIITFALIPFFIYLLCNLIKKPSLKKAIPVSLTLYILFSLGDIGGFYMVIIGTLPIALYILFRRMKNSHYSLPELSSLGFGVLLFIVLTISWSIPFMFGTRPELTTSIVTQNVSFSNVSGISPLYTFSGFIGDNSSIFYVLLHYTYSSLPSGFYGLYLILPALFLLHVILYKSDIKIWIVLGYSAFFAVIAMGNTVPVFYYFNKFIFEYFPLFDKIPAVFRWEVFTVLGYTYLLTSFVQSVIFGVKFKNETKRKFTRSLQKAKVFRTYAGKETKLLLKLVVTLLFIFIILSQNFEVFSSPPGTFSFPTSQTNAYDYIDSNSSSGYIFVVPFGGINIKTPWSRVSESPEFMSPYFTGRNTAMFQAGTPYSLAMDKFIGYGEGHGLTSNITKFLASSNIQYIVSTNYSNWSQVGSPHLDPKLSNAGLLYQQNLGNPVFKSGNQTVFSLTNYSGPLYYTNTYYVYFGNNSLLYDVSNSPFYNSSAVLVNGSDTGSNLRNILSQSSGLICPFSLYNKYETQLKTAISLGIPIYIFENYLTQSQNMSPYFDKWNASNGLAARVFSQGYLGRISTLLNYSNASNYTKMQIGIRANIPDYSTIGVNYLNKSKSFNKEPVITSNSLLNKSVLENVTAHINSQGKYTYNGSIKLFGVPSNYSLLWNFAGNNETYQSLGIPAVNFSAYSGLSFKVNTTKLLMFVAQYIHGNIFYQTSLPQVIDSKTNTSTFYLDYSHFRQGISLNRYVNGTPEILFGFERTGSISNLSLYNFSSYSDIRGAKSTFKMYNYTFNLVSGQNNLNISISGNASLDFAYIHLFNGSIPTVTYHQRLNHHTSDHSILFHFSAPASGLIVYTQTYEPAWNLSNRNGLDLQHVVANLGLNAWFFGFSGNFNGTISYTDYKLVKTSIIIEGISLIGLILSTSIAHYVFRRKKL